MDLSGINSRTSAAGYVSSSALNAVTAAAGADEAEEVEAVEEAGKKNQEAAVYEPSSRKGANALDSETIKAMKDELAQRTQNLAQMMMGQQLETFAKTDDAFWRKFANGEFTVDAETQAQAKKDIAEDGYWGVEQTSDRIVKYATALSGGDPDKLDTMIQAFEKGFKEATKTWGKDLPDISQRTREAVLKKFEDLRDQYNKNSTDATAASGVAAAVGGD